MARFDPASRVAVCDVHQDHFREPDQHRGLHWYITKRRSIDEIGGDPGIGISTTRMHRNKRFVKTGTGRLAKLVQCVIRVTPPILV
jgi:hypothetical protein